MEFVSAVPRLRLPRHNRQHSIASMFLKEGLTSPSVV